MDQPVSNFGFNMMSLLFKARDLFLPREQVLKDVDIKAGFRVLDYGCGPGGYVAGAAKRVDESGKVYALDIHPLAAQRVRDMARKKQLTNVETICSDCKTGLPDNSVDLVLLYDIFHLLSDPQAILAELHRVLKKDGTLSFSDHHMCEDEVLAGLTQSRLFKLVDRGQKTYRFAPQKNGA